MDEKAKGRFNRRLPGYGALGAVLLLLPQLVLGNDVGPFLLEGFLGLGIAIGLLVLFILALLRRETLAAFSMMAVFLLGSWVLLKTADDIRATGRWLLHAKRYKAEVLAQPVSPSGELQHTEWERWGFAAVGDTVTYLVFDPNDSLASARKRSKGTVPGLPCRVRKVHRLEKHWYTVMFYTNTNWDYCG